MPNWLRKLMPTDDTFFPRFDEHASAISEAAQRLAALLDGQDGSVAADLDRLVARGQETSKAILDQIRSSFVTPFDRSDIKEMTSSMQALLEDMQSIARSHANAQTAPLKAFGPLIVECANELRAGVARLRDFEKHADELRRMRDRIAGLRTRMLAAREDAMAGLLASGGGDALAALAASRLLQRVGDLVERFDDVADHIDDLVLDHV